VFNSERPILNEQDKILFSDTLNIIMNQDDIKNMSSFELKVIDAAKIFDEQTSNIMNSLTDLDNVHPIFES